MGKDKIEQIVNGKLGSYESSIDADALWNSIQGVGGASATSKTAVVGGAALVKWLGLGAVVIGAIAIGYWYGVSQNQSDLEITQRNEAASILQKDNLDKTLSNSSEATTISVVAQEENESGEDLVKTTQILTVESTNNSKEASENLNDGVITDPTVQITNNELASEESPFGRKSSTIPPISEEIENDVSQEDPESLTAKFASKQDGMQESTSSEIASNAFSSQNRATINEDFLVNEISDLEYDINFDTKFELPKKVVCPTFGGSSNRGYFMPELQVIPFYANPIYTTTNEAGDEWVARRKATESNLEAFQVNLIGRYQFNSGFYLQGGVGYGQIDEKFMLFSEDIQVTDDEVPVIIILRPNGVSDTIRGNQQIETITTLQAETFNYHRMFELPFAIGYEYGWGTNLGLYVDMGGSVNLTTFRKGFMVIDDVDYVSFDDETRPIYRASTGFKVQGSAGLRYYMSNGLHFSAGPDIRYHTGNWIRDEHPFQQRYFDVGLRLAMGVRF